MSEEYKPKGKLNRRKFITLTGGTLLSGGLLAACGDNTATTAPSTTSAAATTSAAGSAATTQAAASATTASATTAAGSSVTTAAAATTASGAAVTTQAAATGKVVEMELWTEFAAAPAGPAMDAVVEAFNKSHPNIRVKHVKFENTPFQAAQKAAFASGAVPDLMEINAGGWLAPFVDANQLVDITDLVDAAKENFDPGTINVVTYRGKKWAVPFGKIPGNLIYWNKDIVAKHGIDPTTLTTWSAFTASLEKLKAAGVTPITLGNKEEWNGSHWVTHLFVRTMGIPKVNDLFKRGLEPGYKTTLKFTDPAAVKPWEIVKDMQNKGYFSKGILSDDYTTAYAKFFRGDSAYFQTGGWLLSTQKSKFPDFKMGFMLFPAIDGIPESNATDYVFNCLGMMLPKGGKNPEAAREWVKWWLTSEEPHKIWSQNNVGQLPSMTKIKTLDGLPAEVNDFIKLQTNAPKSTMFMDSLLDGDLSTEYLGKSSNGLFSGALTPQKAAETLEQAVSDWQKAHP